MDGPERRDDEGRSEAGFLAYGMRYAGIASQFGITLAVLGYVGFQVDERYGWAPWGILAGILSGMGLGLYAMLKQIDKLEAGELLKKRRK